MPKNWQVNQLVLIAHLIWCLNNNNAETHFKFPVGEEQQKNPWKMSDLPHDPKIIGQADHNAKELQKQLI
jgi:hypothetical protein